MAPVLLAAMWWAFSAPVAGIRGIAARVALFQAVRRGAISTAPRFTEVAGDAARTWRRLAGSDAESGNRISGKVEERKVTAAVVRVGPYQAYSGWPASFSLDREVN